VGSLAQFGTSHVATASASSTKWAGYGTTVETSLASHMIEGVLPFLFLFVRWKPAAAHVPISVV